MSKKHSPFAALSSREQQERWLEFQNTRLPYIEGDVDTTIGEEDSQWLGHTIEKSSPQGASVHTSQNFNPAYQNAVKENARSDRNGTDNGYDAQSMQKTRHLQYDAIIRRMKDAEKQTLKFQNSAAAHTV